MRNKSDRKNPILQYSTPSCDQWREQLSKISEQLGVSPLTARVLLNRGISDVDEAKSFVFPTLKNGLPDPSSIMNIGPAAEMIVAAARTKEQITIYCDFDVDGLTAGSQLYSFLDLIGANVTYYVPNRFVDGYGLSSSAIEKIANSGTKLLITVDCGVSNNREIALAKKRGLRTIIVDHHEINEIPEADIVVDPEQEDCGFHAYKLCASGLVWMLLIVLRQKLQAEGSEQNIPDPKDFLDLAALGTICDMVPLIGPNRIIAARGVEAIKATKRAGLISLKALTGLDNNPRFNAGHVGFILGPRINAAGRLDDASSVFEMLITVDSIRANQIAQNINSLNEQRRQTEEQILEKSIKIVETDLSIDNKFGLVVFDDSFHLGVIGIVAQRLVDRYGIPVAVMAPGEAIIGKKQIPVIKGSVRSVKGFNVAEALKSLGHLCINHGGHAQAGGFAIITENLESFKKEFERVAAEALASKGEQREIRCDAEISLGEIDFKLADEMTKLAPFGIGNPSPLFASLGTVIDSVSVLNNGHFRLRFTDGCSYVNAIAWGFEGNSFIKKGNKVNIVYSPEINTYQGVSSVQLNIKELWVESENV